MLFELRINFERSRQLSLLLLCVRARHRQLLCCGRYLLSANRINLIGEARKLDVIWGHGLRRRRLSLRLLRLCLLFCWLLSLLLSLVLPCLLTEDIVRAARHPLAFAHKA